MSMDLRVLAIYKQHYLDRYDKALKCMYSSLGYYDGFDIEDAGEQLTKKRGLFTKSSDSPIASLWYATQEIYAKQIDGLKGMQIVGLFREKDDLCNYFWAENNYSPYFAIGFAQLVKRNDFKTVADSIERIGIQGYEFPVENKKCARILTYYNFDNADLVILVHGNSIKKMQQVLKSIENNKGLRYVHTIQGIREDFLSAFADSDGRIRCWEVDGKKTKCYLGEKITNVTLEFVTSGSDAVRRNVRTQIANSHFKNGNPRIQGIEKSTLSYVYGHESFCVLLENTDVKSILAMLVPNGLVTHQNGLYGSEIYNIQTGFTVESECLFPEKERKLLKNTAHLTVHLPNEEKRSHLSELDSWRWCQEQIVWFKDIAKYRYENKNDECLYASLLSVSHTLNTLAQYGGFDMARDIYCLLFRSFYMFQRELYKSFYLPVRSTSEDDPVADTEPDLIDDQDILKDIRQWVRIYLEAVNSVIYHTIHTDQIYLMLPGYCGTSFNAPIKLQLFYMNYMEKLINVIYDDEDQSTEYQFLISPVTEARPKTSRINFGKHEGGNCLIVVTLSQRSLVFPRAMMIILAHEIAHYVGNKGRLREVRLECLIEALVYILVHCIFAPSETLIKAVEENPELQQFWIEKIVKKLQRNLIKKKIEEFMVIIATLGDKDPTIYYASKLKKAFVKICKETCLDIQMEFDNFLNNAHIDEDIQQLSDREIANLVKSEIQKQVKYNIRELIALNGIDKIVAKLIYLFKEIYSDVISQYILGSSFTEFLESFSLSEGLPYSGNNKNMEQKVREYVMNKVLEKKDPQKMDNNSTTGNQGATSGKSVIDDHLDYDWRIPLSTLLNTSDNYLRFQVMLDNMEQYACQCRSEIEKEVDRKGTKNNNLLVEIRNMYMHFSSVGDYNNSINRYSASELYEFFIQCISSYEENVFNFLKNPV